MKQNRKATLELFVEKADELRKEDFTQFIEEFGHQLSYQYTTDPQQLTMTTVAPSQTMHKSFLLTYRMFVQGSEHMRLLDPKSPLHDGISLKPYFMEITHMPPNESDETTGSQHLLQRW